MYHITKVEFITHVCLESGVYSALNISWVWDLGIMVESAKQLKRLKPLPIVFLFSLYLVGMRHASIRHVFFSHESSLLPPHLHILTLSRFDDAMTMGVFHTKQTLPLVF